MNIWQKALLVLPSILVGCTSPAENACRADIKSKLLNPETAEFHDFDKIAPPAQSVANNDYHTYRVRADSKIGLKVTTVYSCASTGATCACTPVDGFGQ